MPYHLSSIVYSNINMNYLALLFIFVVVNSVNLYQKKKYIFIERVSLTTKITGVSYNFKYKLQMFSLINLIFDLFINIKLHLHKIVRAFCIFG